MSEIKKTNLNLFSRLNKYKSIDESNLSLEDLDIAIERHEKFLNNLIEENKNIVSYWKRMMKDHPKACISIDVISLIDDFDNNIDTDNIKYQKDYLISLYRLKVQKQK